MLSLQIMEGLIGAACAIACLYYARQGRLATAPQSSSQAAPPWHSAVGEHARKNPFAAVFGALALGFLLSSWSMYALPRSTSPRMIEKWHTITRNVQTPDPTQAAKIAALQTTINANTATIASQKTEIDRLNRLLAKRSFARSNRAYGEDANANTTTATVAADTRPAPTDFATAANAGTPVPPAATQSNAGSASPTGNGPPAGVNGSAADPNAPPANSTGLLPH